MADVIVLDNRIGAVEGAVKELKDGVSALDDACDSHSDRLLNLEIWKRGNGAKGAEDRLQATETTMASLKECLRSAQSDEAIERIATAAANGVIASARTRDKTTVAKLRALGPLLTGAAALLAAIVTLVAVFAR
jgi:hypothetical protein